MTIIYPGSPVKLDRSNPLLIIKEEERKLWSPDLSNASRTSTQLKDEINSFIIKNEKALAHLHTGIKEPSIRLAKIHQDLFPYKNSPIQIRFSAETDAEYKVLYKRHEESIREWELAFEKVKPRYADVYKVFERLKVRYAQFLDEHRIDPDSMENPHPKNIRVLAAISQLQGSNTPNTEKGEKISPHPALIARLIACTTSMDEMIAQAEKEILLAPPYTDTFPYKDPYIQKPISTPCRENLTAWRKEDNNNPNIRRVVLLIPTEEEFYKELNAITENYTESSHADFNTTRNLNTYRVDEIITVSPPTFEETLEGLTHAEKIKKAFQKLEDYIRKEKESNPKLSFEGIAHWHGHGTWLESGSPSLEDDRTFYEGSREFSFITDYHKSGLSETEIKELERSYLKDFSYFIHEVGSCHSGALIA